jgi:GNAT superfamily N-acetyltransferase
VRFFHPDHDRETLPALVALCHPDRPPRSPLWWQIIPTIVVDAEPPGSELIGYTQFSYGDTTLFLYDTGVHPAQRRAGLGRRLMAERIDLGRRLGATRAIGMAEPGNVPMRTLLAQAQFVPTDVLPGYYQEFTPPRDGMRYLSTPASFEWAHAQVMPPAEVVEA